MSFSWKENLPKELSDKVTKVESMIQPRLEEIDEQVLYNQQRVLDLFRKHHVGEEDLVPSTGYGYDDIGRDKIEDIYADYFKTDDALVRHNLVQVLMQLLLVYLVCFVLVTRFII